MVGQIKFEMLIYKGLQIKLRTTIKQLKRIKTDIIDIATHV